jgi:hypothetical protein
MSLKRARLVVGLLALLLAATVGCATSATVAVDQDGGTDAKSDRAVQQDAPPFFEDAAQSDAEQTDAAGDAPGDATVQQDGQQDAQRDGQQDAQQDAQHDAAPQQDAQHDAVIPDGGCAPEADEALGGDTCLDAINKGSFSDLASNSTTITGNLWPAGDVDWYKITFVDSPDDNGAADKFNAKIAFTATGNPGSAYAFDVLLDNCSSAPVCGTTGDSNLATTVFEWNAVNENPCNADPVNTVPGRQVCVDNSMILRIRVFRLSGTPVCENYELKVENGGP